MLRKSDFKRILIVRLSAIGDVVVTTPVAKALRGAFPEAHIAWIVEDKSKEILEGNPYLDEVIVWDRSKTKNTPLGYLRSALHLRRELVKRHFDVAIDFQGLMRSAVIARLSGARQRLGYDNAREKAGILYDVRLRIGDSGLRGHELLMKMLGLLGVPCENLEMHVPIRDEDRAFARRFIAEASSARKSAGKIVALCPATTWPHKHWTEEGWACLADALVREHNALPVFMGGPGDRALVDRILSLMGQRAADAVGKTTLKQAAAILEQSSLVVAVDTGLLHIGVALDRPVIGVFGPSEWQFFVKKDNFVPVAKDFACIPCVHRPTCSEFDCMKAITADDILRAAERWLGGKRIGTDS